MSPGTESSAPEARRTKGPGKLAGHSTWSLDLLLQTGQAREGFQTMRSALNDSNRMLRENQNHKRKGLLELEYIIWSVEGNIYTVITENMIADLT